MFYYYHKLVVLMLAKSTNRINGDRLRCLLKENGLKMSYFNNLLGKNRSYLSNVLSGSDSIDDLSVELIAEKLNTTPEYLKGETDKKEKPVANTDDELVQALKNERIRKIVDMLKDADSEELSRFERIVDAVLDNRPK